MATAYIPIRSKGQTTCHHHKGRQLEFYCKECMEVICVKCLSSIHSSHPICELSEIIPQKKPDIQNFIDRTENNDLIQSGIYIASADTLLKDNDRMFEELSHQLMMQTEKLKQDLDNLTAETLSLYQKTKDDNAKLIQKYKQDLEIYDNQLKEQMTDCKSALQQGSHIDIYDTECVIDSRIHLPVTPVLCNVSFTPNKNPQGHLEQALGKVTTSGQDKISYDQQTSLDDQEQYSPHHTSTGPRRSVSTPGGQGQSSTQQTEGQVKKAVTRTKLLTEGQVKKAVTRTKLLTEARVVEKLRAPCGIYSICPITDDQAWTNNYCRTLTLLDRKGKVIREVKHKAGINDISMSSTIHRLWACDIENNILELVSGQLSVRFRTKATPKCICVTSTNHIIVGMSGHISKYTTQGQLVLTTKATRTRKPLVCTPYRITECPITTNVAVIDYSNKCDGGDGNKHVVVMDSHFQKLFVYRGDIPSTYKQTPQTGGGPFDPEGIVYDSQGNIIIGDHGNCRILLVNGIGDVLSILHTDTDKVYVRAIGVGRDDLLWSSFRRTVKLLQYHDM